MFGLDLFSVICHRAWLLGEKVDFSFVLLLRPSERRMQFRDYSNYDVAIEYSIRNWHYGADFRWFSDPDWNFRHRRSFWPVTEPITFTVTTQFAVMLLSPQQFGVTNGRQVQR